MSLSEALYPVEALEGDMLNKSKSIARALRRGGESIRNDGWLGVEKSAYGVYKRVLRRLPRRGSSGVNVFDFDWDALVILDACRVDALNYVAGEYDWLDNVESYTSLAGRSDDWLHQTFHSNLNLSSTDYISANPYTVTDLEDSQFQNVFHLTETDWDDHYNTVPARTVTNHAIRRGRADDAPDRQIIHYMQPHFPSIPAIDDDIAAKTFGRGGLTGRWTAVRTGEISKIDVIEAYLENLRYVLDDVELLLENLDASNVMITSDHGTSLGDWGIYGHSGMPLAPIFSVPVAWATATDEQTHQPPVRDMNNRRGDEVAAKEKLSALGYIR